MWDPLMRKFLGRVADVLSDYLGGLNDDLIKDNFVIVYQLLDEMMDSGFPMTTEPNILKEIIVPPNLVSRVISVVTGGASNMGRILPSATSSNVRWRASGIKHANNEIYFDLMEEMDATVNRYSHHMAVLLPSIGDFDAALALN
jgi:AP-3 complex subunit mu